MRDRSEDPVLKANWARIEREDWERTLAQRESLRLQCLTRGNVPERFWAVLKHPNKTDAVEAMRVFLEAPPECVFLLLSGGRGTGKTFAGSLAVQERGGYLIEAQDLALRVFDKDLWWNLEREHLVFIDELGSEFKSEPFYAQFYALLNARYGRLRKTVLATNLNAEAFRLRYPDPRLLERLRTAGTWVNVQGDSMRQHWAETEK